MQKFQSVVLMLQTIMFMVEAQSGNEWWLSDKKFSSICCECVPFFGCIDSRVNNEKLLKHEIEKRVFNVQTCPNMSEYCCLLPDASEECKQFPLGKMPPKININPQPNINCECTSWKTCPLEKIITDGKGRTSKSLTEMGLISHSKCTGEMDVCCVNSFQIDHEDSGNLTAMESKEGECECISVDLCSKANINGEGVIEPRFPVNGETNLPPKKCESEDEVCCPLKYTNDQESHSSSSCQIFSNYFFIIFSLLPLIKFM